MQPELNETQIWYLDLSLPAEKLNEFSALLVPEEQQRAQRFRFDKHRNRYIAAHGYLRLILHHYLGINPVQITLSVDADGKPYIPSSSLQFNLSHSQDRAVYAIVNQHRVGVDIEKIENTYTKEIAARYFTPDENAALQRKEIGFYAIWARKEALIKATGKGLDLPIHEISVLKDSVLLDTTEWRLYPLQLDTSFASALVTDFSVRQISYWEFTNGRPNQKKVDNIQ